MNSYKKILNHLSKTLLLIYFFAANYYSVSYCADNSKLTRKKR